MAVLVIGLATPTPMPAMTWTATISNSKRPQKTITITGIIREMDVIGMDIGYVDIVTIVANIVLIYWSIRSSLSREGKGELGETFYQGMQCKNLLQYPHSYISIVIGLRKKRQKQERAHLAWQSLRLVLVSMSPL